MKMILMALVFILCANHLQAALGETETELVKRYGKIQGSFVSQAPPFTREEFEHGGYHISVTLLEGQSHREIFTRLDQEAFTPGEMQLLLDASALGSKWDQKHEDDTAIVWVLDSKEGFAGYYKKLKTFIVKTGSMLAVEETIIKAQQQQQSEDPTKNRSLRP
jgi:hypothetical protein